MEARVQKMEPCCRFAFSWDPGDPALGQSCESQTLVEFDIEKTTAGTLLTVIESGFNKVPKEWRDEAMRRNEYGWTEQMTNIENYLSQPAKVGR